MHLCRLEGRSLATTKTLAVELGQFGIRVHAVHPGYIWSDKQKLWFEYLAHRNSITYERAVRGHRRQRRLRYLLIRRRSPAR